MRAKTHTFLIYCMFRFFLFLIYITYTYFVVLIVLTLSVPKGFTADITKKIAAGEVRFL